MVFQLVGIAFITAVAVILIKNTKPELAFAVSVAGGIILLLITSETFRGALSVFSEIAEVTGIDASLVKIILKMIGIGYLVEFSAGILSDFGQNSLADKLVFAGKILVLVLALPIVRSVLELVKQLLEMIP